MRRILFLLVMLAASRSSAFAWGCDGHRTVALIAERYARPSAVAAAKALLAAHPMDATPGQFCGPFPGDPIVEAATWADDFRPVDPSTGPWHFIDFPLASADATSHFQSFCPGGQCVVAQIAQQYAIARTSSDPAARARALRFLIHLIGDLHQPLHAITNGDRGGNCVPVTYFGDAPADRNANGNFSPNLHGVWDTGGVTHLMKALGAASPAALAAKLAPGASPAQVGAQMPTVERALSWAAQTNALAKSITYGKLPKAVPVEPASQFTLASCSDNNNVGQRMLALNEVLGAEYEAAARPVVRTQLVNAGKRLAAALDALFP
jgi:hypothetical protein